MTPVLFNDHIFVFLAVVCLLLEPPYFLVVEGAGVELADGFSLAFCYFSVSIGLSMKAIHRPAAELSPVVYESRLTAWNREIFFRILHHVKHRHCRV